MGGGRRVIPTKVSGKFLWRVDLMKGGMGGSVAAATGVKGRREDGAWNYNLLWLWKAVHLYATAQRAWYPWALGL